MRRRRGTGSVRQLPSGRWQARFGSQVAPLMFDSRADGERWLRLAAEQGFADAEATTRRYRWGVQACSACGHDFRPARRRQEFCDDCATSRRAVHMRAARMLGSHSDAEWQAKLAEFGGLCAYCEVRPGATKDHVVPVSRGGSDAIDNIVPACGRCNSSKGARLLAVAALAVVVTGCGSWGAPDTGRHDPRNGRVTTEWSNCGFGSCLWSWKVCVGPDLVVHVDGVKPDRTFRNSSECAR